MMRALFGLMSLALAVIMSPGAVKAQTADMCGLIAKNPSWQESLRATQEKWQVKPSIILAIIDHESRFKADARGQGATGPNPMRNFGYAQARLTTWNWYLRETGQASGSRTDFALATDFIGWHFATMEPRIGAPRNNVFAHYLAYKVGEAGFRRGAPESARALATRIQTQARQLDVHLNGCGF
jgi:hypothetical protein